MPRLRLSLVFPAAMRDWRERKPLSREQAVYLAEELRAAADALDQGERT